MTGWTADLVEARMVAAAATMRVASVSSGPGSLRSAWPQVVMNAAEAYGYQGAMKVARQHASGAALEAMDEVLRWLSVYLNAGACERAGLPSDGGWIAWQRAAGWPWPRVCEHRARRANTKWLAGGNSREAVRQIGRRCLVHVAGRLEAGGVPLTAGLAHEAREVGPVVEAPRQVRFPSRMDMRPMATNRHPCGLCGAIRASTTGAGWRCGKGLGEVSPTLRAQYPSGEPCWEPIRSTVAA